MNDKVYVIFEGHGLVNYDDYYQCMEYDEELIRIYSKNSAAIEHLTEWTKRTMKMYPEWALEDYTDSPDHSYRSNSIVVKAYQIVRPNKDEMFYCRVEEWNIFDELDEFGKHYLP